MSAPQNGGATAPRNLKLYFVGYGADDWPDDGTWSLVFAENPEQARELVGDWPTGDDVSEVVAPATPGVMLLHSPRLRW